MGRYNRKARRLKRICKSCNECYECRYEEEYENNPCEAVVKRCNIRIPGTVSIKNITKFLKKDGKLNGSK